MFTVLHQRDGIDTFHIAPQVQYVGPHAIEGPHGLRLLDVVEPVPTLQGGVVFVMNAQGATVAKYDLAFTFAPSQQAGPSR